MADMRGHGVVCDERCGCPVPCPGGVACSCYTSLGSQPTGEDNPSMEHKKCTCGEHCGCNPCTCNERVNTAAGCKCGADCACATCAA